MATISGRRRRATRRSRADIAHIRDTIVNILSELNPQTVRQVFYQLVSRGVIAKTEAQYKQTVIRLLVDLRVQGVIPFGWVSDNTRWQRKPTTFSSLQQALNNTARTYRRALWDEQDVYVEVWCEKDALAGVLLEETAPWDVPLMVSRGFASVSYLYECAESIADSEKPAYLYYFGDHDPSGVMIDKVIERRLREFAPEAEIYFQRVAVLPSQIDEWNLPTRPTKFSGTHAKSFDGDSVELDAIPADQLRTLVRESIEQHVDQHALEITRIAEENERSLIVDFAKKVQRRKRA